MRCHYYIASSDVAFTAPNCVMNYIIIIPSQGNQGIYFRVTSQHVTSYGKGVRSAQRAGTCHIIHPPVGQPLLPSGSGSSSHCHQTWALNVVIIIVRLSLAANDFSSFDCLVLNLMKNLAASLSGENQSLHEYVSCEHRCFSQALLILWLHNYQSA